MLVTRNIFLDTSVIVSANFEYRTGSFEALAALVSAGQAKCFITPIIVGEVESNIEERVGELATALARIQHKHPISRNFLSGHRSILSSPFDMQSAATELTTQFHEFLRSVRIEILPLDHAPAGEVFRMYFAKMAPFGPGKKKSEFPDAFNVAMLEAWCHRNKQKMYVVSEDGDLADYCSTSVALVRLKRPAEFVDLALRQSEIMKSIEEAINHFEQPVKLAIAEQFEGLGFYLDDEQGEVEDVTVEEVAVEEFSLLGATNDVAQFEVSATIRFLASGSYDDMDTAIWDSEDKVSIPIHTKKAKLELSVNKTVLLAVQIDAAGQPVKVVSVRFPGGDIPISVNRYEGYP